MLKFLRESHVENQVLSSIQAAAKDTQGGAVRDEVQKSDPTLSPLESFHHEDNRLPAGASLPWRQWLSVHVEMEVANSSECGSRSCH
jgi:hypothetical protein